MNMDICEGYGPDKPVRSNPEELPKKLTKQRLFFKCDYNVIVETVPAM